MSYQQQVNSLRGALGPIRGAYWPPSQQMIGAPWELSAQPMMYSPQIGQYIGAYASNQAPASASFTFPGGLGWGRRYKRRRSRMHRRRRSRKPKKRRRSRKNRN